MNGSVLKPHSPSGNTQTVIDISQGGPLGDNAQTKNDEAFSENQENLLKKSFYIDSKPYVPFIVVTAFAELVLIFISLCIPPNSDNKDSSDRKDSIQKQKNIYFAVEIIILLVILFEISVTYYILRQADKNIIEDELIANEIDSHLKSSKSPVLGKSGS